MPSCEDGPLATFAAMMTFHDFTVKDLAGNDFPLAQLKGKKVLVVNVASACGYTPQYALLQDLYDQFGGDTVEVVAFPCNDFGGQEPGSAEEIRTFCETHFGVTFPLMGKVKIKGKTPEPLFAWLQQKELNGVADAPITWNFFKFLIDEEGRWVKSFGSGTEPVAEPILQWLSQTTLF